VITITFNAIEDLTVKAGSFKVFSLDFSFLGNITGEGIVPQLAECTGQAYLEYGTCKQIQANLQMTLLTLSSENQKTVISVSSTLAQNLKP
jgi:hypothetical protein